jgi:hypothetical protein
MLTDTMRATGWIVLLTIAGGISPAAAHQDRPDFSGRWSIESTPEAPAAPAPAGGSAAPALRPDQRRLTPGDMGSGWGSSVTITQDAAKLIVEQALFSRYDIYPQPRLVYALDGSETRNAVMIGHTAQVRTSRSEWDGDALRITSTYPAVDPGTGKPITTEVTHRLSLESPTTLVVEVVRGAASGGKATTTRTIYRKS